MLPIRRRPIATQSNTYSRPFTIARLEHHRRRRANLAVWLAIMNEEAQFLVRKWKGRVRVTQRLCSKNDPLLDNSYDKSQTLDGCSCLHLSNHSSHLPPLWNP